MSPWQNGLSMDVGIICLLVQARLYVRMISPKHVAGTYCPRLNMIQCRGNLAYSSEKLAERESENSQANTGALDRELLSYP